MYKGHMDKAKGGRIKGGKQVWVGWGEVVGKKWRQRYLNNNLKKRGKIILLKKEFVIYAATFISILLSHYLQW